MSKHYSIEAECKKCGCGVWGDRGVDPRKMPKEHKFAGYMLKDDVWVKTGLSTRTGAGYLCIECAQELIGRDITPSDFHPWPINFHSTGIIDYLFPGEGVVSPEIHDELIELERKFLRRMEMDRLSSHTWKNWYQKHRRRTCREMADEEMRFIFGEL